MALRSVLLCVTQFLFMIYLYKLSELNFGNTYLNFHILQ